MWNIGNDYWEFDYNSFRKMSKFDPKGDATIEMYLLPLDEKINIKLISNSRPLILKSAYLMSYQQSKLYIQSSNEFLKKILILHPYPDHPILCINVVDIYVQIISGRRIDTN